MPPRTSCETLLGVAGPFRTSLDHVQNGVIISPPLWGEGFPGSSAGKESACNTGDPGSIPGLGRSPGEGIGYPLQYSWASLGGSDGKESTCNEGDLGSIPGLGRSPREGNG